MAGAAAGIAVPAVDGGYLQCPSTVMTNPGTHGPSRAKGTAMAFNMRPRRYTPESLTADSRQVRRLVADLLSTVPPLPADRRKLGEFMRAHPGQPTDPIDARIVRQAGHALMELADAMEGTPAATQEPL